MHHEQNNDTKTMARSSNIIVSSQQLLAVLAVLSGSWDAVLWGGADETRELVTSILGDSASSEPAFTASVLPGGLKDLKDFLPWRASSTTPPEVREYITVDTSLSPSILLCVTSQL